ncbi:hypothetical protein D3C80_1274850 [compost metagenome]
MVKRHCVGESHGLGDGCVCALAFIVGAKGFQVEGDDGSTGTLGTIDPLYSWVKTRQWQPLASHQA